MKKFIIMGLTLFAFALVGCKDDKGDDNGNGKDDGKDDTPAQVYTITNTTEAAVTVSSGEASASVEKGKCVSVKADQWAALKVDGVCDNSDTAAEDADEAAKQAVKDNDCPAAGNKNIAAKTGEGATGNELADGEKGADCAELAAPAPTPDPDPDPAPTTTGSSTGSTTGATTGSTTGG